MRNKIFTLGLVFTFLSIIVYAQEKIEVNGVLRDADNGETIIGAIVQLDEKNGIATDVDGFFKLKVFPGNYELSISYIGYTPKKIKLKLIDKPITLQINLSGIKVLNEVEIVADVAKQRETPVAFSTIDSKKIQQELGVRDLPMILNSTPGVYATESGGGAGDSRINIRGFDQRNVAVMVDGVPFNDMENGAVFWSNWEGLNNVTRNMQVQRGLGASKLAIASVGGTINIITKGIDQNQGGTLLQEIGNNNALRTSLSYNSGQLNKGWGYTFSFSRRTGDGWVDQTWINGYSYFLKVQKRYKKHLFSLGVNGAAQQHGQRVAGSLGTSLLRIANYDADFAKKQGINTDSLYANSNGLIQPMGLRYNSQWGYYKDRDSTLHTVNERVNYYTKPVFNFSDFINVNEKLFISNVAYLSIGKGGGASPISGPAQKTADGQVDYQDIYNTQTSNKSIISNFDRSAHLASTYMRSSVNNHIWFGALTSAIYKYSNRLTILGGLDLRSYTGIHYQTAYDLLGGDYVLDNSNNSQPVGAGNDVFQVKHKGDKVGYNYKGQVRWAGAFGQAEYKVGRITTFLNLTYSMNYFQRVDYFLKKDLVLNDTTYHNALGYGDTITRKETKYTIFSPEAKSSSTGWKLFYGYTFKTGANFNITEYQNVFMNIGYLVLPPRFVNIYDRNNKLYSEVKNQFVKAIEGGYGFKASKFAINVNAYYTVWNNRPPDFTPSKSVPDGNGGNYTLYYNINGMDARHTGFEVDFNYKIIKNLSFDGVFALGDWKYTSKRQYNIVDVNGQPAIDPNTNKAYGIQEFDAKGIYVGNAAQMQIGGSLKYEIKKGFYIKPRITYFGKNYSNFDPTTLVDTLKKQSWKMPNYYTVDLTLGYDYKWNKKLGAGINIGVVNIMNTKFISDAQNNVYGFGFNANSAGVFFGQGRRYTVGIKLYF